MYNCKIKTSFVSLEMPKAGLTKLVRKLDIFSVGLRTGTNPADIRSHTGK